PGPKALEKICRTMLPGYDPWASPGDSYFDRKAAIKALAFFHEKLRHVEGAVAGKPFKLERWQVSLVANLFGWLREDSAGRTVRRYRKAFIYVPRKNGKTVIAAGICLYLLCCDGERGAQVVSAAAEREQAALLFRHARGMVEQSPWLSDCCDVFKATGLRSIVLTHDAASSYKVISTDAFSKHGLNLHAAVVDELHAQPNRDLVDVLNTAMASENRAQPLMIYITTADFMRDSICNEELDYARKVRDGVIDSQEYLPVVYEADPAADDWTSPKLWARVNPNLGVSVSRRYLEQECKRAQDIPAYENTFKRLHLNMQTEQDVRLIPMELWNAGSDPDFVPPKGVKPLLGVDLSTTTDVSAIVELWPNGDGWYAKPRFYLPADNIESREKRDRVPYATWARMGFITLTPGNVIDYGYVRRDINERQPRKIGFDPWNATQTAIELQQDGLNVVYVRQGFVSLTAPTKELLRLLQCGLLKHDGNPCMTWMASNCASEEDAAGNIKLSKNKSPNKIDGMAALINAIYLATNDEGEKVSIYNKRPRFVSI
ncbi:MAG TPA: terminase TerL endonuclease subunit, partial [Phycisphaerae bacterium]|nr:terminase TerL endonuclease subunit [Phycisphaerae bacterium]